MASLLTKGTDGITDDERKIRKANILCKTINKINLLLSRLKKQN